MKRVVLIHTVKSLLNTFDKQVLAASPEPLEIFNILDDYLVATNNSVDSDTRFHIRLERLRHLVEVAESVCPDAIVVTCSTLSICVRQLAPQMKTPLLAIDYAATAAAVEQGRHILVFATSQNPIEPVVAQIHAHAQERGVNVHINTILCTDAFNYLEQSDMENFRKTVLDAMKHITGQDVVFLAQASTAHLRAEIQTVCGCKVIASPEYCIQELMQILYPIPRKL